MEPAAHPRSLQSAWRWWTCRCRRGHQRDDGSRPGAIDSVKHLGTLSPRRTTRSPAQRRVAPGCARAGSGQLGRSRTVRRPRRSPSTLAISSVNLMQPMRGAIKPQRQHDPTRMNFSRERSVQEQTADGQHAQQLARPRRSCMMEVQQSVRDHPSMSPDSFAASVNFA